jgi:hypothetical protein
VKTRCIPKNYKKKTKEILAGGGDNPVSKLPDYPEIDFMAGGQWLVDAVKKHGVNENGDRLRWNNLLEETLLLIGDFRFGVVSTSGGAQIFKSLTHWQLVVALMTAGGRDWMWVYPQATMIYKLVPTQFRPIIDEWERSTGLSAKVRLSDSKAMTLYQSARGTGRFASANNPNQGRQNISGLAAAAAGAVSFPSDLGIFEEASQYSSNAAEVFDRRLLQSKIPTIPKRFIGTPGRGAGIEREILKADYNFYPHQQCSGCGEVSPLHPLGWLLKNIEEDSSKPPRYLDAIGKPAINPSTGAAGWHHSDPSNPSKTAIFACPHCSHPITREERLTAWFQCLKTGERLRDVVEALPKEKPEFPISAGITLSPLIRDTAGDGAVAIITKGLATSDPQDWQQQELGIPSTTQNGGITLEMIANALRSPLPRQDLQLRTITAWGLDQGTNEHWLCITRFHITRQLFGQERLTTQQVYEQSHREVLYLGAIHQDDVLNLTSNCDGGAIDNEPGRDWANDIRRDRHGVVLADQRGRKEMANEIVKEGMVKTGGDEIPVLLVDTHQMQTYILGLFATGRITLPSTVNPEDLGESSATRHLTTSNRDGATGAWTRPADNKDDLLKAMMFTELWFYCHLFDLLPESTPDWKKIWGR